MTDFSSLPLRDQASRLERLRAIVILLSLGDDDLIDRLLGDIVSPAAEPLPDGADVAAAVEEWLAGGAS